MKSATVKVSKAFMEKRKQIVDLARSSGSKTEIAALKTELRALALRDRTARQSGQSGQLGQAGEQSRASAVTVLDDETIYLRTFTGSFESDPSKKAVLFFSKSEFFNDAWFLNSVITYMTTEEISNHLTADVTDGVTAFNMGFSDSEWNGNDDSDPDLYPFLISEDQSLIAKLGLQNAKGYFDGFGEPLFGNIRNFLGEKIEIYQIDGPFGGTHLDRISFQQDYWTTWVLLAFVVTLFILIRNRL